VQAPTRNGTDADHDNGTDALRGSAPNEETT